MPTNLPECPTLPPLEAGTELTVPADNCYATPFSCLAKSLNDVILAHNALVGIASPPELTGLLEDVDNLQDAVTKLQRDYVTLNERITLLENA